MTRAQIVESRLSTNQISSVSQSAWLHSYRTTRITVYLEDCCLQQFKMATMVVTTTTQLSNPQELAKSFAANTSKALRPNQDPNGRPSQESPSAPRSVPENAATESTVPDIPLSVEPSQAKASRANLIILQVSLINFLTSLTTGILTVGLPKIAADLHLPDQLYLWPSSVYGLTTGSTLLLAGAIADVVGARSVDLLGCSLLGIFTLACGFSTTGIHLVIFRAFQGVGSAMHLPCSVSLITAYVPSGRKRNIGFGCLGLSAPFGFSVGLVLGGVLVDTAGWRLGFYIPGGVTLVQAAIGFKIIPTDIRPTDVLLKMRKEIDWVGAAIASTGLALFSYVLSILSADSKNMQRASSISMLVVSVALIGLFPVWMWYQQKHDRPALVPNHLWKNRSFSCICVLTIFSSSVINSIELFTSLYFQEVQESSPIQASLQMLPMMGMAVILNFATGYVVDRAPIFWLVLLTTILTAGSPLMMALMDPEWSYWKVAFTAQLLAPLSCDVLFTIGLIVVSETLPEKTQALAGAVCKSLVSSVRFSC